MVDVGWASPYVSDPFSYTPLGTSDERVRLLRMSRDRYGYLKCTLGHFRVIKAPTYRAVSYMWGSSQDKKDICVNGRRLAIRASLYSFFEVANTRLLNKWLWIDQVCIIQNSTTERNNQVQLMSEIFSGAKEVISWVDPARCFLIRGSRDCDRRCTRYRHRIGYQPREGLCSSLCRFLWHPYWGRLWIAQEILLAQHVIIWFGTEVYTWQDIDRHVSNISNDPVPPAREIRDAYIEFGKAPLDLLRAIEFFGSRSCEDVRDKIYGTLALVRPDQRLTVDYRQSAEALFRRAAVLLLTMTGRVTTYAGFQMTARALATNCWTRENHHFIDDTIRPLLARYLRRYGRSRKEQDDERNRGGFYQPNFHDDLVDFFQVLVRGKVIEIEAELKAMWSRWSGDPPQKEEPGQIFENNSH